MGNFSCEGSVLVWQENQHKVWLQPWGKDGLRIQANLAGRLLDLPQALLETPAFDAAHVHIEMGEQEATIKNGLIQATVSHDGRLRYANAVSGEILLEEPELSSYHMAPNRHFKYRNGRLFQIEAWFKAQDGERFFGLGQHQHGRLDQKGCVIELHQRNTEVTIPFLVSSRKYGFLWNNPSIGRVELGVNATRWVAEGAQQLDYYVVCGETYADILERYTDMGDWRFDPHCWPDPPAMVRELESMGVRLMVSIWPTVSPISENYQTMRERGLLINNEYGVDAQHVFVDHEVNGPAYFAYYDATNPDARQFIWETIKKHYYAQGVRLWWLDNDEPDVNPWHPQNLRFYLGNGVEVANIYPLLHQMAFFEGMRESGETEIVTLSRSAWAGSQRFGSVIWSGDIASTFEALQAQVRAGLNVAMSGIPWWTTDIGGFHGGDISTDYFRELIVRWFQYGVFCPIFRLHGYRLPADEPLPASGAGNELWSFGDDVYEILRELLFLRERLRPYIQEQMQTAAQKGIPPMRPLIIDFSSDPVCETIDDEFMFGPEILVAPVLYERARERDVYLPAGTHWMAAASGANYAGGQWITAAAPLDTIPVFLRADSSLRDLW
jgi:alpha-D-xyloside xylohydrolase